MNTDMTRQLLSLEHQLLQPGTRHDLKQLDELLADNFVEFAASGSSWNKPQVIAALHSESPSERTLENFRVQLMTNDVALVTYRCIQQANDGITSTSLRSSVWQLSAIGWQMVFHQGTRADE